MGTRWVGGSGMNTVFLDCRQMGSQEQLHSYLMRKLEFPQWYGKNLDGLFDLLSGCGPICLALEQVEALDRLGGYGRAFLNTLWDAAACNPNLSLMINGATPSVDE